MAEIYGGPISFSDPVRVLSIGRNPIQVLLIRSDPVRVLSIRSDPIRSRFCKRPPLMPDKDKNFGGSLVLDFRYAFGSTRTHVNRRLTQSRSSGVIYGWPGAKNTSAAPDKISRNSVIGSKAELHMSLTARRLNWVRFM